MGRIDCEKCGDQHGSQYDCSREVKRRKHEEEESKNMTLERARMAFESFILNNRMDDPRNGSLNIDSVSGSYIDPRIQYGWVCWKAAKAI